MKLSLNTLLGRLKGNEFGQRWSVMKVFDIPDANDPTKTYLHRRRIVQTPYFGLYVHRIYMPDADRDCHDHPWGFISWVVRGGYIERIYQMHNGERRRIEGDEGVRFSRHRWSVHKHPTSIAHVIETIQPETITVVLVGPRSREWGFWTLDGFVNWREYERTLKDYQEQPSG